jgi:hypothetical protein
VQQAFRKEGKDAKGKGMIVFLLVCCLPARPPAYAALLVSASYNLSD